MVKVSPWPLWNSVLPTCVSQFPEKLESWLERLNTPLIGDRDLAQTCSIKVDSRGLTRFYDGINDSLSTYSGCKFNKSRVRCFNRPPCSYSSMIPKTDNHTDIHSAHIIMGMTMVSLCTASIDENYRTFVSISNTKSTTTKPNITDRELIQSGWVRIPQVQRISLCFLLSIENNIHMHLETVLSYVLHINFIVMDDTKKCPKTSENIPSLNVFFLCEYGYGCHGKKMPSIFLLCCDKWK